MALVLVALKDAFLASTVAVLFVWLVITPILQEFVFWTAKYHAPPVLTTNLQSVHLASVSLTSLALLALRILVVIRSIIVPTADRVTGTSYLVVTA